MNIKLTEDQLQAVKGIIDYTQIFCDHVWHIMQNHALDKVGGSSLCVSISPDLDLTTLSIHYGETDSDAGSIYISRGKAETKYTPFGTNSPEYELMFAEPEIKEIMQNILTVKPGKHEKKQTPPDGLWI